MASTASEIRELPDSSESRGSHLERAGDHHVNIYNQRHVHNPNGPEGGDLERDRDVVMLNVFNCTAHHPNRPVGGNIARLHETIRHIFDAPHPNGGVGRDVEGIIAAYVLCIYAFDRAARDGRMERDVRRRQDTNPHMFDALHPNGGVGRYDESSIPWHMAFLFLIPVLAAVLQVHSQGSNSSPFETHLPNMLAFLLAILVYCFALVYYARNRHGPNTTGHLKLSAQIAIISGCFASASLISVMLPRYFEPIIFVIWFFLSIYFARDIILHIWRWIIGSSSSQ